MDWEELALSFYRWVGIRGGGMCGKSRFYKGGLRGGVLNVVFSAECTHTDVLEGMTGRRSRSATRSGRHSGTHNAIKCPFL